MIEMVIFTVFFKACFVNIVFIICRCVPWPCSHVRIAKSVTLKHFPPKPHLSFPSRSQWSNPHASTLLLASQLLHAGVVCYMCAKVTSRPLLQVRCDSNVLAPLRDLPSQRGQVQEGDSVGRDVRNSRGCRKSSPSVKCACVIVYRFCLVVFVLLRLV